MPQKKSAFKRLKQDKKKNLANKAKISEVRTLVKKVRALLSEGNKKEAEPALRTLESKFCKAVKTNTIKKNAASRKISRLKKLFDKTK